MTPPVKPEVGTPAPAPAADVMAEFRKLLRTQLESAGSGVSISEREERLLRENFKMRERLRTATDKLAGKKDLPEGSVVLSGDAAKEYETLLKAGVAIKDIPAALTERTTLAAEKAERDGEAGVDKAAEMLGVPNAHALRRLAKAEGLEITIATVKVRNEEGKMVEEQVPVVRKRGAAADVKPEPLADALERDYNADLPALMLATEDSGDSNTDGTQGNAPRLGTRQAPVQDDEQQQQGTRFPRQRTAAPSGAGDQRKKDEKAVASKAASGLYAGGL